MYQYFSYGEYICILVDTPIDLNGYPYFAEVLELLNTDHMYTRRGTQKYSFGYRMKNYFPLNDRSNYNSKLFVLLIHDPNKNQTHLLQLNIGNIKEVRIKNLN